MGKASVLKAPVITEKSMAATAGNLYTFEVEKDATKHQIKKAVEKIFGVDVLQVRTISLKGKRRRTGRYSFEVPGKKKAIIKVESSQKIEGFGETPAQTAPAAKKSKEKKEEKA